MKRNGQTGGDDRSAGPAKPNKPRGHARGDQRNKNPRPSEPATAGAAVPERHSNAHAAHHLSAEISTRGLESNAGAGLAHPKASNMAHGYGVLHGCASQPRNSHSPPHQWPRHTICVSGSRDRAPRADLGGRSGLPSKRTSLALCSRSRAPSRQLSPKRGAERGDTERTSPHAAACKRSRDALC